MTGQISNGVKQFNILIVGTGGQGQITLLQILAQAAFFQGYDIKTSELHGLSQRGGSVEVHIRFGQELFSPLISKGKADLILALEAQESLRGLHFTNPKTIFLINKYFVPIPGQKGISERRILNNLKEFSKNIIFIPAAEICQKEFETNVTAGIYLLGLAVFKKLIPLKPDSILKAIKKIIPEKHLELNKKTFQLAKKHAKEIGTEK